MGRMWYNKHYTCIYVSICDCVYMCVRGERERGDYTLLFRPLRGDGSHLTDES